MRRSFALAVILVAAVTSLARSAQTTETFDQQIATRRDLHSLVGHDGLIGRRPPRFRRRGSRTTIRPVDAFRKTYPRPEPRLLHQGRLTSPGSSRESASRFLATLERAGVISQGRGRLVVHDPDALRNYVY